MGYEYVRYLRSFIVLLNWAFWICLIIFIVTRKKWSWKIRGACLSAIAVFFITCVFIPMYKDSVIKAEKRAYRKAAYDYFHKKCAEDSGRFVYKTVENPQESVYMMKPRKDASTEELRDQFWMGDPYSVRTHYESEIETLLGNDIKGERYAFLHFVEAPDQNNHDALWRYSRQPTGGIINEKEYYVYESTDIFGNIRSRIGIRETDRQIQEMKTVRDAIDRIQSNYGYTWDDLSTREDRKYWVAKSRLQIIDLRTHEVIAERIGYVIEEGFGTTLENRKPWSYTGGGDNRWKINYCPPTNGLTDPHWIL